MLRTVAFTHFREKIFRLIWKYSIGEIIKVKHSIYEFVKIKHVDVNKIECEYAVEVDWIVPVSEMIVTVSNFLNLGGKEIFGH